MSATGSLTEREVAFDHGRAYDQLFNVLFFDEFLSDDESEYIDVNGVSVNANGEIQTVLDYMYTDLSRLIKIRNEIKDLIDFFEFDLGAKKYTYLKENEK